MGSSTMHPIGTRESHNLQDKTVAFVCVSAAFWDYLGVCHFCSQMGHKAQPLLNKKKGFGASPFTTILLFYFYYCPFCKGINTHKKCVTNPQNHYGLNFHTIPTTIECVSYWGEFQDSYFTQLVLGSIFNAGKSYNMDQVEVEMILWVFPIFKRVNYRDFTTNDPLKRKKTSIPYQYSSETYSWWPDDQRMHNDSLKIWYWQWKINGWAFVFNL